MNCDFISHPPYSNIKQEKMFENGEGLWPKYYGVLALAFSLVE